MIRQQTHNETLAAFLRNVKMAIPRKYYSQVKQYANKLYYTSVNAYTFKSLMLQHLMRLPQPIKKDIERELNAFIRSI